MVEAQELTVQEAPVVEKETLDELLPAIQRLSAHDKLVLIRILAEELAGDTTNTTLRIPPGTYEIFTPYDVEGISNESIERFKSQPKLEFPSNAS
jgi:hypothetical protein